MSDTSSRYYTWAIVVLALTLMLIPGRAGATTPGPSAAYLRSYLISPPAGFAPQSDPALSQQSLQRYTNGPAITAVGQRWIDRATGQALVIILATTNNDTSVGGAATLMRSELDSACASTQSLPISTANAILTRCVYSGHVEYVATWYANGVAVYLVSSMGLPDVRRVFAAQVSGVQLLNMPVGASLPMGTIAPAVSLASSAAVSGWSYRYIRRRQARRAAARGTGAPSTARKGRASHSAPASPPHPTASTSPGLTVGWHPVNGDSQHIAYWDGTSFTSQRRWDGVSWADVPSGQ